MVSDRRASTLRLVVRLAVAGAVVGSVGWFAARAVRALRDEGRTIRLDPAWLVAAVALYVPGLALCGVFYGRILRGGSPGIGTFAAVRAYLISHLGKYVPGKAMVVVVRVGLTTPSGPSAVASTFATIYETLAMMAAGGLVAAVGLAGEPGADLPVGRWRLPLGWIGLALGLGFLLVISPGAFPRVAARLKAALREAGSADLPPITAATMAEGLAWTSAAWVLLGLSQVAVLRSLSPAGVPAALWPAVVGSVALATTAGFVVALAPGGLGVREVILWTALGSAIDHESAVVAALVLRLTWLLGEVVAALVLLPIGPSGARPGPASP